MRLAVIADIHGNLAALEAVLADLRRRDIDQTINLGDCASGPLWPKETCSLLMQAGYPTARGNHDRWVAEFDPARLGAVDRFTRDDIDVGQRRWLGALPTDLRFENGVLAFHATPHDDNSYLLEDVESGRLVAADEPRVRERLGPVDACVVLCAHSHLPRVVRLVDGPLIANPGSVGCPAYRDPTNPPHVSEAAAPHARYAIVSVGSDAVSVELIAIEYAWEDAARRAESLDRPDWAHALRTGFVARGKPQI